MRAAEMYTSVSILLSPRPVSFPHDCKCGRCHQAVIGCTYYKIPLHSCKSLLLHSLGASTVLGVTAVPNCYSVACTVTCIYVCAMQQELHDWSKALDSCHVRAEQHKSTFVEPESQHATEQSIVPTERSCQTATYASTWQQGHCQNRKQMLPCGGNEAHLDAYRRALAVLCRNYLIVD
jgi:hypothetical protein